MPTTDSEATSKAQYGFAHGEYLEGKAAAERVISMLRSENSPHHVVQP